MIALSFQLLTGVVFMALLLCFLIGLAVSYFYFKRKFISTNDSTIQSSELEEENQRLRLRVSSLKAAEERARVLEKTVPDLKRKLERLSTIETRVSSLKEKAGQAANLESEVIDLREEVLNLRAKAESAPVLEKELQTVKASMAGTTEAVGRIRALESELVSSNAKVSEYEAKFKNLSVSTANVDETLISQKDAKIKELSEKICAADGSESELSKVQKSLEASKSSLKLNQEKTKSHLSTIDGQRKRIAELEESDRDTASVSNDSDSSSWIKGTTKLGTPGSDHSDDLKVIKGIGPVMEKTLHSFEITSWEQIAAFTKEDIIKVTDAISAFPGRIERDDWIGGAQALLDLGHPDPKDIKK